MHYHQRCTPNEIFHSSDSSQANTPSELTNIITYFHPAEKNQLNYNITSLKTNIRCKRKESPAIFKNRHIQEVLLSQYDTSICSKLPKPIRNQLLFSSINKSIITMHPINKHDKASNSYLQITGKATRTENHSRAYQINRYRLPSIYQSIQKNSNCSKSRNMSASMTRIMKMIASKINNSHSNTLKQQKCMLYLTGKKYRSHTMSKTYKIN